jgi:hypothetical protein
MGAHQSISRDLIFSVLFTGGKLEAPHGANIFSVEEQ